MWTGFGVLFLVGAGLFTLTLQRTNYLLTNLRFLVVKTKSRTPTVLHDFPLFMVATMCCISSLAYLAMAADKGWATREGDGRQTHYVRYLEWAVAIPVQLMCLAYFSDGDAVIDDLAKGSLIVLAEVMVSAGAFATFSAGKTSNNGADVVGWVFWAFGMVCMLLIFLVIAYPLTRQMKWTSLGESKGYRKLVWVLVATWTLYPIVWTFTDGTGLLCVDTAAWVYLAVDLVAKLSFTYEVIKLTQLEISSDSKANSSEDTELLLPGSAL